MPLRINGDAADLTENPVVRQWLWPGRIDRKGRNVTGMGCARKRWRADQHGRGYAGRNGFGKTCDGAEPITAMLLGVIKSSRSFVAGFPAWRSVNSAEVRESIARNAQNDRVKESRRRPRKRL